MKYTDRLHIALILSLTAFGVADASAQSASASDIREAVQEDVADAFATYREYLSLPNDGHFYDDIEVLLQWVDDAFQARGFTTELLPTPGNPLLLAERRVENPSRTVLVYLQSDGQPVDPSAWHQESPYQPVLKEADGEGGYAEIP